MCGFYAPKKHALSAQNDFGSPECNVVGSGAVLLVTGGGEFCPPPTPVDENPPLLVPTVEENSPRGRKSAPPRIASAPTKIGYIFSIER